MPWSPTYVGVSVTKSATWTQQTEQQHGAATESKRLPDDEHDSHLEQSSRWRFGSAVHAARALNSQR